MTNGNPPVFGLRSLVFNLRSSVFGHRPSVFGLQTSIFGLWSSGFGLRPSLADGIRESQRRKTRGLETLHTGINSLSLLARFNQFVTAGHHDPILQHDEADALDEAVSILKSVVLPALQERVPDDTQVDETPDKETPDDTQKDDEFQDEFPTKKRRRRSQSDPTPRPPQSTAR